VCGGPFGQKNRDNSFACCFVAFFAVEAARLFNLAYFWMGVYDVKLYNLYKGKGTVEDLIFTALTLQ